jgi:Methyltransferase domain
VVANALASPFADASFDVVFSNSLIEHLGTEERQRAFASEVRRLSKDGYFVQTPNRWFPIEPHYLAPLVQFVPQRIRPTVIRWMTPFGWLTRPSREGCRRICSEIRLLSAHEMRRLFPDAEIVRERFFGFTKSLIAVRPANKH